MSESTKKLYGNYKVYHPNDKLMFYCDKKRYNWYLERNLAKVISDKCIKLTFEPNGFGEDDIFLSPRENKCVVSGNNIELTKHHVIPYQYRKHFPVEYKSRNANDVVALHVDIHYDYEKYADILKAELIKMYITSKELTYNISINSVIKYQKTLEKYKDNIPKDKTLLMESNIQGNLSELNMSLDEVMNTEPIDFSELIVEREGIENLIVMWKSHFIEHTKPKFLPNWWDKNYIKIVKNNT